MKAEENIYKANIQGFLDKMQNAFVEKIVLSLDTEPGFETVTIPFTFRYAYFATIITDQGGFKIMTSISSDGVETFWIKEEAGFVGEVMTIEINSTLKSILSETTKRSKYAFKLAFQFDNEELFIYCGEIYDNGDGTNIYRVNDEMLLVFDSRQEAMKFEALSLSNFSAMNPLTIKKEKQIANAAIVAAIILYLAKFLRPYFSDNNSLLFILGFLPNFGLAFAIPFVYVSNRARLKKPVKYFTIACIVTLLMMILNEIRDKFQSGRVFDWYDIYASIAGVIAAFLLRHAATKESGKQRIKIQDQTESR